MSPTVASGRPVTNKTIHPNNAYLVRAEIEVYDETADVFEPWTGTNAKVTFAIDDAGTTPISGLVDIAMAESPTTSGTYFVVVQSAATAILASYVGDTIYQIVYAGPTYADAKVVTPLVVRQPRFAGQA